MWLTSGFLQVEFDSKQRCSTKLIHIFKLLVCRDPILFCGGEAENESSLQWKRFWKIEVSNNQKNHHKRLVQSHKRQILSTTLGAATQSAVLLVGWFSSFWLQKICRFTKLHTFTARDPIVFGVGRLRHADTLRDRCYLSQLLVRRYLDTKNIHPRRLACNIYHGGLEDHFPF